MAQASRVPGRLYSAYIFFAALFGRSGEPGALTTLLFPGAGPRAVAAPSARAASDEAKASATPSSGTLGASASRFLPSDEGSARSPLWWLYAGGATLLAALAVTALAGFVRRRFSPRTS